MGKKKLQILLVIAFLCLWQVAYAEVFPAYVYTEANKTIYLIKHDDVAMPTITTWEGEAVTHYERYDGRRHNHLSFSEVERVIVDQGLEDYQWSDVSYLFRGFEKVQRIEGLQFIKVDTMTKSTEAMFFDCASLTSLDISHFNTVNVRSMAHMFYNCASLTSLDVTRLKTDKVTDMSSMFATCTKLSSVDLSNFKTESLQYMGSMFDGCFALLSLDLSHFNTGKVQYVDMAFAGCLSLKTLHFKNFNGASLLDPIITDLLTNTYNLEYIDFSNATNLSLQHQASIVESAPNPFTLKYMPKGSTLTGRNVITNDGTHFRCEEYFLSDDTLARYVVEDFYNEDFLNNLDPQNVIGMQWEANIPYGFTADKVTNSRSIGAKAGSAYTWFMPYVAPIPAGVDVYEFKSTSMNGAVATFVRSTDTELRAQKPYLVLSSIGSVSTSVDGTTQVLPYNPGHDVVASETSDGWAFVGSFQWRTTERAATEGLYTLQTGNKWKHYEGSIAKPRPFRAFLKKVGAGARQLSMNLQDGADITSIQHIELLDTVHPDSSLIYDLDGRYLGTRREVLQPGVYVIGGKTTRVN